MKIDESCSMTEGNLLFNTEKAKANRMLMTAIVDVTHSMFTMIFVMITESPENSFWGY